MSLITLWTVDEWIAENCCCGINNQGDWDELLLEEFGCDCADRYEDEVKS